jgi:hypothetical protein
MTPMAASPFPLAHFIQQSTWICGQAELTVSGNVAGDDL